MTFVTPPTASISFAMAGAKGSIKYKLARRFVSRLAKELASDGERGFCLASNTQDLKEALRKSADSLPSGKLRSTLHRVLEQDTQLEAFISSLQIEIRVLSAKLELHGDVLLTSTATERLFQILVNCVDGKTASPFTDATGNLFNHDEIQLLLARDPAPQILWALAATKATHEDAASGASAAALLYCLKPWVVHRNASVAVATMAPLVPLILESVQEASRDVGNFKALRNLMKEVLSFIVAVNYRDHFMKGAAKSESKEALPFSALLDGFWAVSKAFKLQGTNTQAEMTSEAEKLDWMFPLASEVSRNALKPSDVPIGRLADIVKSEFLLLYMVVEVLYCRQKSTHKDKLVKNYIEILREQIARIAVNGLAVGQTDLILDILLSNLSSLHNLLDDEEKSLVCVSVFKALLLNSHEFFEKSETFSRGKKALEGFVKRIAVARKYATKQRTQFDILDSVACYLKVPPKLVDYLRSCKLARSLLQKETSSDRALIGWLVQLDDADFQALMDGTRISNNHAEEKMSLRKLHVGDAKAFSSSENGHNHPETEDLFFLDTTGEKQAPEATAAVRKRKKSRKQKAKEILFHRQGRMTKVKEDGDMSDGSSDSSESRDRQSADRGKRRNEGESSMDE